MAARSQRLHPVSAPPIRTADVNSQILQLLRDRFDQQDDRMDQQDDALQRIDARVGELADTMGSRVGALEQAESTRRTAATTHAERDQRFTKRTKALWAAFTAIMLILATAFGPWISAHI